MKVLFASVLALLMVVALCVATATISASATTNSKLLLAKPKSLDGKDPSIISLPPKIGLPFGDFSAMSASELKSIAIKQFPILFTNSTSSKKTSLEHARDAEIIRFVIFKNALAARGNKGDEKMLVTLGTWKCEACEFAIEKMEDALNDGGCDAIGDTLGSICASIPVIGPFTVPECIEVLKWGCGEILELVEDHIYSTEQICDKVFGLHCE